MAATVIPFAGPLVRAGWSARELAEIYRLADSLSQRGVIVELEMGVSDEGDPWLVLSHPGDPDVAAHLARIDGRYLVSRAGVIEDAGSSSLRDLLERMLPGPAVAAAIAPARLHPDFGEALLTATLLIALGVVARELGPGVLSDIAGLTPPTAPEPLPAMAERWLTLGREAMALLAPVAAPSPDPVAPDALAGLPPAPDPAVSAADHQPAGQLRQWIEHLAPGTVGDDPAVPKLHPPTTAPQPHSEGSSTAPDLLAPDAQPGHQTQPAAADPEPALVPGAHSLDPPAPPVAAAITPPQPPASPATVTGPTVTIDAAGGHTIVGSSHGDIIFATSGNDLIIGGDGNNLIVGGSGQDTIISGAGNDTLVGGSGAATISGGAGNDLIIGGGKGSVLIGGSGNDVLISNDAVQTGNPVTTTVNDQTVVVSRDSSGQVTVQSGATGANLLAASPPPPPPPASTATHADTTATTDATHASTDVTLVGVSNLPHNQLHL